MSTGRDIQYSNAHDTPFGFTLWLTCSFLVVGVLTVARFCAPYVFSLPMLQLIGAPVLILLFSRLRIAGVRIPRIVIALSLLGVLLGAVLTYSHIDLRSGAFVVARFSEDNLEKETKIFRDRIRKVVGWKGLTLVGTHYGSVASEHDARSLVERNQKLGGVIWGTPRWLSVTLRQSEPLPLFDGEAARFAQDFAFPPRFKGLKLITSVGGTGLSTSTEYPTVDFLGRLAVLWSSYVETLRAPQADNDFERLSRSLAGVKGAWTTFAHRAVPMWMTGTYHLRRALVDGGDQVGEVLCAIRALNAAFAQLRPGDNPELQVAILNNQALAYVVRAQQIAERQVALRQAQVLLKQAAVLASSLVSRDIVSRNNPHSKTTAETVKANVRLLLNKKASKTRDSKARRVEAENKGNKKRE